MRYRKKPVVIEAVSVNDLIRDAGRDWKNLPAWFRDAYEQGSILIRPEGIDINTLEGVMIGSRGDYIIRGVKGELYPCKPDVFAETYEQVTPKETNR